MKAKQIFDDVNELETEWEYLKKLVDTIDNEDEEVSTPVLHNYRGAMRRIATVAAQAREKTL